MDLSRMTQKLNEAMLASQALAARLSHQHVDGEHLLVELLAQNNGLAPRLLEQACKEISVLKSKLQQSLSRRAKVSGQSFEIDKVYITQRLQALLAGAAEEAERMHDDFVSVEHVLLGFIDEKDNSDAGKILKAEGITRESFLEVVSRVRGNQRVTTDAPESKYDALKKYGSDLVELARAGKLDPVIGRDTEIRSVIRILSRKTKNNPVLIGEPGVGKTAIAEGLAQRIVSGDVPEGLKNRALFSLD
ncbi:MAG: Clp protease N-terminal domain-containing protein, partial [Mariprofundaceae bacterium]